MDVREFKRVLDWQKRAVKSYVLMTFPDRVGKIGLRFMEGNFRAQGWQGASFQPWKPIKRKGRILVRTGRLRRGNAYQVGAVQGTGVVRFYNDVPYGAVHNFGFNGRVSVKSHQRRLIQKNRVGTGKLTKTGKERMKTVHTVKGMTTVKAHSRNMNIPKRQFMPHHQFDSPVLVNAIRREIVREFGNIFK